MVWKHLWPLLRHTPYSASSVSRPEQTAISLSSRPWKSRSGYLNLQRRASTNLIFPEGPLSPDLGLSSLLPSHPFHACLSLESPVQRLSPPRHSGDSSLPNKRRCYIPPRSFPCSSDSTLSLQQDAFSLDLRGLGWEGSLGQPQGLGILHIYHQGC